MYKINKNGYYGNGLFLVSISVDTLFISPNKEFNNFLWASWFSTNISGFLSEKQIDLIQKDLDRINKLIAFK